MTVILIPMLIGGIKSMMDGVRARERIAAASLLRFPAEQFVFHTPAQPWEQVNAKNFGPLTVAGFAEPGPIVSLVIVTNLGPAAADVDGSLVTWWKEREQSAHNPWRIVSEGIVERNGVIGWQFETLGYSQGHESYAINWVVATNGFGYILRTSSPSELKARAKEASDYIFSRFEPTAQNTRL